MSVLLYSGEIVPVSSLQPGDHIMGPDSSPRKVVTLYNVKEKAVEVYPTKGMPFVLGEHQVLALKDYDTLTPVSFSAVAYQASITKGLEGQYCLYRQKVLFPFPKAIPLDAYFLGVLLGDGCLRGTSPMVTSSSHAIASCCFSMQEVLGVSLRIWQSPYADSNNYSFVHKQGHRNPLKKILEELGLYDTKANTKFIPFVYRTGCPETRAAILAGLLDTDGEKRGSAILYSTRSKHLAEDVAFIARSLGLKAFPTMRIAEGKPFYRFRISGNLQLLPMRVYRKVPFPCKKNDRIPLSSFTLQPIGIQSCTHLVLEGPDALYLRDDFLVMQGEKVTSFQRDFYHGYFPYKEHQARHGGRI